jgi:lipopolysaccharide/colanic/teichoic acid biosynthesis glycosyltransferase/RimJ/RimL family protein N-acetyltransferase
MNDFLFYMAEADNAAAPPAELPAGYRCRLWRPSLLKIIPRGLSPMPFGAWWLMHSFRLFSNRDYSLLLIDDGSEIVHRSCVFPRYFRFPFMGKDDLQIGDTWTAESHRGKNLAALALRKAMQLHHRPGRRFWYVVHETNAASIRVAEKAGMRAAGRGSRVSRWGLRPLGAFVMEQKSPEIRINPLAACLKRAFDLLASAAGLLVFMPLLLAVALWVKLDSPGPLFYRGRRAGRGGKPFGIFKFRSMVVNADRLGGPSTADDDRRVTRSGRFIRRFKLDELTQLINVLRGEMSLVGPRPEIVDKVALYSPEEKQVLRLRPGITDWASIWNADEGGLLAGTADPDAVYERVIRPTKIQLQLHYCRTRTFLTDLKILFYTIWKVLRRSWVPRELRDYPNFDQLRAEVERIIAEESKPVLHRAA